MGEVLCSVETRPSTSHTIRMQVVEFMEHLLAQDRTTQRIIMARWRDPVLPLATIAKRHRVTTQAVHARLARCAQEWPAVRRLVGLRMERQ
jgi:predicted DNA-binding protein YlxM (UPF0122 family)